MKLIKKIIIYPLLIIAIFSLGYLASNSKNSNIKINSNEKTTPANTCPYKVSADFSKEYLTNEVDISYPPELIIPTPEVLVINKEFKPYEPPKGRSFYTIPANSYPWFTIGNFDVDKDGKKEKIVAADTAMNRTPHLLKIIKNNKVIFEAEGTSISAGEASDHNGFFLYQTIDWNNGEYRRTKYVYDNGKFIPVWNQTRCDVVKE